MRLSTLAAAVFATAIASVSSVFAADIPLGTSPAGSGGLAVYYNPLSPEIPANQAYAKVQFSPTNTNGAAFNFNPALAPIFGQGSPSQFGFDLVIPLNGAAPTLNAVDYNGVGPTNPTPVAFAINDYKPNTGGPGVASNFPFNSIIRGSQVFVDSQSLTQVGTVFTLNLSGRLVTDGFFHWFTPSTPDTPFSAVGLNGVLNFSGSFSYDAAGDPGNDGLDFYSTNSFALSAQAVPLPSTALTGLTLAGGLLAYRSGRRRQTV